ncbi:Ca-activated chloride channel family protein [Catenuloplanes nepalensis]|uniref:Ca-activated chloride channel family protein n=1 Tax=Catenuloplanes nepalensis TaxID=587533 RepID=A0ABT9MWM6_9ACTN|nr:substrate-binding domain-containing protein [Catenuloplanes nepalensis]MDP9795411.1 Ca-activated chloride channel family protein [Catenuloplanes nepalensis]
MRRAVSVLTVAVLALGAAACGRDEEKGEPRVLRVLAGSELSDLDETLRELEEERNIRVELTPIGSVEGARRLTDPQTLAAYDAVWFGADQFFGLWRESRDALLRQSPPLMRSPVVIGVRAELAVQLGWDVTAPSWADIVDVIADGGFRFGMTRPDHSNSGLAGLVAAATALADTGLPITEAGVPGLRLDLRRFFAGHRLSADTSAVLSDAYVAQVESGGDECGRSNRTDGVDGLLIYESEVARMNGVLPEDCRLKAIYPTEGTMIAEYRLSLLSGATDEEQRTFDELWQWLFSPDVQQRIQERTGRRPGNPDVTTEQTAIPSPQLRYPTDPRALSRLIDEYQAEIRTPSRMVFVLDVSGSMDKNMPQLRNALVNLTGTDPNDPATYFNFLPGERVDFVPFSDRAQPPRRFVLPEGDTTRTLTEIQEYATKDLRPQGYTAMYDALRSAHELTRPWLTDGTGGASTSIVLFSDGQNTCGTNYGQYMDYRRGLSEAERSVPIYTIAFDSGDQGTDRCGAYTPDAGPDDVPGDTQWERELRSVAEESGGELFTTGKDEPLYPVFWSIRGYQ